MHSSALWAYLPRAVALGTNCERELKDSMLSIGLDNDDDVDF